MAAPVKPSVSSRWGSFLSVVEGRIDNILADAEDASADKAAPESPEKKQTSAVNGKGNENGLSRPGSSASHRTNDRLQERLAKAVAQKNAALKVNNSNVPSRTASPSRSVASSSPRQSLDSRPGRSSQEIVEEKDRKPESQAKNNGEGGEDQGSDAVQKLGDEIPVRTSTDSSGSHPPRLSTDSTSPTLVNPNESPKKSNDQSSRPSSVSFLTPAEYENQIQQMQRDFETIEIQRLEEIHGYVERLDGLQAKLQYLSKEVAESAKSAASEAPAGSLEKKLAEKEQQIIDLMEEGLNLSKTEMKNMNTIKALSAKITQGNKEVEEAQKKTAKAENEVSKLADRVRKSELAEKNLNERLKSMTRLQREIETVRADRDSKDSTIASLKAQLEQSQIQTKQAKEQINTEALQAEKKRVSELEEELTNTKIEKELAADRSQARIKELQEQQERNAERARVAEMEFKAEQNVLESKLEVMRARAEEVSSGATGDAQAKLLRQVETLQSQYAVASENWKGIEASLVSRMTSLEKERDETARREADVRRKAREVTLKSKRNEEELEETKAKLDTFQHVLTEHKTALDKLQKRAEDAENKLKDANAAFEQEKQAWKAEKEQQEEDEKSRWRRPVSGHASRAESPANIYRNGPRGSLTPELLGFSDLQFRRTSVRSVNGAMINEVLPAPDRLITRRASAQPPMLRNPNSKQGGALNRQDSMQSFGSTNGDIPETPRVQTPMDQEDSDDFQNFLKGATHASPHDQTINDMVSVSTLGAGPSVQLVERMSAAVRRLESEKAATQEEMARLVSQRDEARKEISNLMEDVEKKKASEERVSELERQMAELGAKYETTLEMLGEKSERVDELMADVADVKDMYRTLVLEKTGK